MAQKRTISQKILNKKQQKSKADKELVSERIEKILEVLSATTRGDFLHYCEIKNLKTPDSLDALSIGINIMISDLGAYAKNFKETIVELNKKTEELEKFNKLFVGRELKMTELKKEIETLKGELAEKKE